MPLSPAELTSEQKELRDEFIAARGFWNAFWDGLLTLDPEFFKAYLAFSGVPWQSGPLEPKVKELIYIAIDAATTHLYEPGLRQHIRNALNHGATKEEIMEVLELVSVLGIHACTLGVPVLMEELEAAGAS
jgi:alkylhydroperoxidase/carboxymuconolactone decarboxylase family protein YurZ